MWIAVWLIASAVVVVFLAVALVSWLILPAIEIGRSASRFQAEVGSLTDDISRGAARAGEHTAAWSQDRGRRSR